MKAKILTTLLLICTLCSYAQVDGHFIYPSANPTDKDSVIYVIRVPLASGSWKMSGTLTRSEDSILYKGCYFKSITSTDEYIYDTVMLGTFSTGIFHLSTIVKVSPSNLDTYCELPPEAVQTRYYDTTLLVSKYTGIRPVSSEELQSVLSDMNKLHLDVPHAGTASIQVYDALGRLHHSSQAQVNEGKNDIALDMPNLPSGLYVYHIQLGQQRKMLKCMHK